MSYLVFWDLTPIIGTSHWINYHLIVVLLLFWAKFYLQLKIFPNQVKLWHHFTYWKSFLYEIDKFYFILCSMNHRLIIYGYNYLLNSPLFYSFLFHLVDPKFWNFSSHVCVLLFDILFHLQEIKMTFLVFSSNMSDTNRSLMEFSDYLRA